MKPTDNHNSWTTVFFFFVFCFWSLFLISHYNISTRGPSRKNVWIPTLNKWMYHNQEFISVKERCTCDILLSNFGCLLIRWIYNDLILVSLCLNIMYHQDCLWHGIKYLYFRVSRAKCHDLSLITKVSSISIPSLWITLPWEPLIAIITVALL